ncbi:LytTR family DNA-binding domain-containing protein [Ferruginibacter sp. HRS2-29]|uniref:LytR/AlgR family response regulator transcription factor n=1 Tax=Ferruginibacter sp. HRS2-29 TaxID=2487334 RepID=UPI0020CC9C2F|nr:LytTR family DNA-binding domain-containing protein [Ferruginibacter sp. HRS2-29]MCP9750111.1 DNA-binding response regulator [Ferruginibacter sp. HRS2-29]
MIKALIIDDEVKARNILKHYVENFISEITEVQQAESVDAALALLETYKPDVVFLDVEMPHKNGFDFLTALPEINFDVIFTTAYNQYAIQAIRFSALDYLLKPVDPDELKASVLRHLEKKADHSEQEELYRNLVSNIEKKDVRDFRIAVPSSEGVHFFTIDEILRLEAERSYTHIHLVNKRPFLASKTLRHFEEMLTDFNFIRTHKSHLVNPKHITRVSNDKEFVLLTDGSKVEVSRRKKDEVFQQLKLK